MNLYNHLKLEHSNTSDFKTFVAISKSFWHLHLKCRATMQQLFGRRLRLPLELTAFCTLIALCVNIYIYLHSHHFFTKLIQGYSNQNLTPTYEYLPLSMIDTRFGYMSAYYDNRSNAVVVFGKVFLTWLNATVYVAKNATCDFYGENEAFVHSVNLYYFTTYMFYCNLSRNATVPRDSFVAFGRRYSTKAVSRNSCAAYQKK